VTDQACVAPVSHGRILNQFCDPGNVFALDLRGCAIFAATSSSAVHGHVTARMPISDQHR
jgi:hypothetical protein